MERNNRYNGMKKVVGYIRIATADGNANFEKVIGYDCGEDLFCIRFKKGLWKIYDKDSGLYVASSKLEDIPNKIKELIDIINQARETISYHERCKELMGWIK